MSLMPSVSLYGLRNFQLDGKERTASPRKLDALTLKWQTDSEDTFDRGGALPGYPLMDIEECVTKEEIPGMAYEHTLRGKGLLRPGHKLESSSIKQPEEGWDEGPQTWITSDPDAFQIGLVHPTIPTLWCVGIDDKEEVTSKVWRVTPSYKGIILDGDGNPKPATWKVTVNGQNINSSAAITLGSVTPEVFTDEDGVWNGWASSRKASFDVSKLNLVKTMLSTTPAPTERVGLSLTPEYIPAQFNIFDDVRWVAASFTYNYPSSCFKLAGVQSERILDKELYLYTLTYEYNPLFIPTF